MLLKEENCTIVIQVNGRKRGILEMPINSKEVSVVNKSREMQNVSKHIVEYSNNKEYLY